MRRHRRCGSVTGAVPTSQLWRFCLQTGEYATDEEQEMSPVFPNSIEVFDLAENQDMLSPVELDPEKLAHKFKEVRRGSDRFRHVSAGGRSQRLCFFLKLQIKHAVTQAEIQLLKRKVRPPAFLLFLL